MEHIDTITDQGQHPIDPESFFVKQKARFHHITGNCLLFLNPRWLGCKCLWNHGFDSRDRQRGWIDNFNQDRQLAYLHVFQSEVTYTPDSVLQKFINSCKGVEYKSAC
jgi:hypothetical protein